MGITANFLDYLSRRCQRYQLGGSVLTFSRLDTYFHYSRLLETAARDGHLPRVNGEVAPPPDHPFMRLIQQGEAAFFSARPQYREQGHPSDKAVFYALGFNEAHSLDVSTEVQPDFLYDLNRNDLDTQWGRQYDLVIEAGTMEHVFHVPNVLKNAFDATKVGGYILHSGPSNNLCDHGFYQFSPTFYLDYYTANRFDILEILLVQSRSNDHPWFIHEYSPGSLAKTQYGGLDDKLYGTLCLVRKRADSTWGQVPMQGVYLADQAWREGLTQP